MPGGLTEKVKKFPDPLIFAWMRASDNSMGGDADRVAKLEVGNRAPIAVASHGAVAHSHRDPVLQLNINETGNIFHVFRHGADTRALKFICRE